MSDPEPDGEAGIEHEERKRFLRRRIVLGVALILAVAVAFIWTQRQPIAERFVQGELDARNVRASYDIKQIAVRTQRIENLVLGDPARPDLTAGSVEVDISYSGLFPRVAAVRARGVRLYGRLSGQGLQLGEVDKFRDPSSGAPFGMPDIDLTLDDARMRLETPAGPVGLSVQGSGNLQAGFTGKVAALIRDGSLAGCSSPRASAYLDINMTGGSPHLAGPVRSEALICDAANVRAAALALDMDVTLSPDLAQWAGQIEGGAKVVRAAGVNLASPQIDLDFDGDAKRMSGDAQLALSALGAGGVKTGGSLIEARWDWQSGGALTAQGRLDARAVRALDAGALRQTAAGLVSTPVGPLAQRLAGGLNALQSGNRLRGDFMLQQRGDKGTMRFSSLALRGRNGSHVSLSEGSNFAITLPDAGWTLDGGLTSGGGGLPEMALRLRQGEGGGLSGEMFLQPYEAKGARLAAERVRFAAGVDGMTRITTALELDGPLPDGHVRGLELPVEARLDGNGGFSLNPGCVPVRFAALKMGSVQLGRNSLRLCPAEGDAMLALRNGAMRGGAQLAAASLVGRLGETPMRLSFDSAGYSLRRGGFDLAGVELRLGDDRAPVLLAAKSLDGTFTKAGIGGRAGGIAARIGTVPLLVRDGDADWRFAGGKLTLDGSMIIYDDANPDRFHPLKSPDFRLALADSRINASGSLQVPGRARRIARVDIVHRLDSGRGHADLRVDGLRFDKQLQPDEITPLALGVVANVYGSVDGEGRIDWTGSEVTSTGEFSTSGMDLAAAFGPVDGLSTHIRFTDLIGLVTAPHQELRLASVNPGIEARDGIIHYALLPEQRVAVEDGYWPFAGGDLRLLPAILDMGSDKSRRLTFRVVGIQAGAFIQLLELENISATGTFDGLLPMVFDDIGGRIEGGILNARQQGMPPLIFERLEGLDIPCDSSRQAGNLAYVGQVSNEDVGFMGKLAFDALKDLQYKCLTILMDGAIDGEVVTQVMFNGINRGELSTVPKPIASQFIGLPFVFNIKIEAPFRGLMNTARSFTDPSQLIRQHLGDKFAPAEQNGVAVQPRESETMSSEGIK